LLSGPRDLDRWDLGLGAVERSEASSEYLRLFENYEADLQRVAADAERAWDAEIKWLRENSPTPEEAVAERWTAIPGGPSARPTFVALIRRFWLAVDALNRQVPVEQAVPPEVFLVKWVMDAVPLTDIRLKVLAVMPYWPLGLDTDGNWI
jgi:hypothetical protein